MSRLTATAPKLFYFQCSLCRTTATSPIFSERYSCVACLRWMRFLYSTPATTDDQLALVKHGLVFNPHRIHPQPWTCVRCGEEFRDLRPTFRTDGKCCRDCVKAEAIPPLLTPEEQEADTAERAARAREDQERMDAAYRRAEQETR